MKIIRKSTIFLNLNYFSRVSHFSFFAVRINFDHVNPLFILLHELYLISVDKNMDALMFRGSEQEIGEKNLYSSRVRYIHFSWYESTS